MPGVERPCGRLIRLELRPVNDGSHRTEPPELLPVQKPAGHCSQAERSKKTAKSMTKVPSNKSLSEAGAVLIQSSWQQDVTVGAHLEPDLRTPPVQEPSNRSLLRAGANKIDVSAQQTVLWPHLCPEKLAVKVRANVAILTFETRCAPDFRGRGELNTVLNRPNATQKDH